MKQDYNKDVRRMGLGDLIEQYVEMRDGDRLYMNAGKRCEEIRIRLNQLIPPAFREDELIIEPGKGGAT